MQPKHDLARLERLAEAHVIARWDALHAPHCLSQQAQLRALAAVDWCVDFAEQKKAHEAAADRVERRGGSRFVRSMHVHRAARAAVRVARLGKLASLATEARAALDARAARRAA